MGIEIIGKLTQKNNGDFKLVDLADVDYDGTGKSAKQELENKIEEAKNSSTPYDDTEVKTDINNIKTDLGTEELTTTSKKIKGSINELSSQIKEKVNKGEGGVITNAMLSQEVKEAMTGGSVAVVGKDSVLTENIVDKQVTFEKIDDTVEKSMFINLLNTNKCLSDNYLNGATCEINNNIITVTSSTTYGTFGKRILCNPRDKFVALAKVRVVDSNYIGKKVRFKIYGSNSNFNNSPQLNKENLVPLTQEWQLIIQECVMIDDDDATNAVIGIGATDIFSFQIKDIFVLNVNDIDSDVLDKINYSEVVDKYMLKPSKNIAQKSIKANVADYAIDGDFIKITNKLTNILPDISNKISSGGVDNLSYSNGILTFTPNVSYGSCLITIPNTVYMPKSGTHISISCYVKCVSPDSAIKFRVYECDSLGHTIQSTSGNNIKTVLNEYTLLSETFTISNDCDHILIGIGNAGEVYSEVSVQKIMFLKTDDLILSEDNIKILGGYWDDKANCVEQSLYSCKSYSLDSNYELELIAKINNSTNSKWKDKTWYCIGDSIMNQKGIQPLVQNQLGIGTVINDCVSGQLLKTMVDRVDSTALTNVDLVTIHCTTNDYKRTPLGQKGDITIDTFYGAIYNAINTIYNANNKVRLAFIISHRVGDNQYFPNYGEANEIGKYQYEYGDAVKDVCKDYGIPVLDMYTNSGINKYTFSLYTADNVHLSTDGFKLYRDMMCPFLNSI